MTIALFPVSRYTCRCSKNVNIYVLMNLRLFGLGWVEKMGCGGDGRGWSIHAYTRPFPAK